MGVKSTHKTTREIAIKAIISKLSTMDDDRLSDILELAINNRFYNFIIVPDIVLQESINSNHNVLHSADYLPSEIPD